MIKLDSTDKRILILLQQQGRMTNAELSKQVGLSAASVLERVKKLERSNIIEGYHAQLNLQGVGIGIVVLVEVTLAKHRREAVIEFIEAVQHVEEIIKCFHVTGRPDFILRVVARDIPSYETFVLEKLSALPGVQHLETMVILSTVKDTNSLPLFIP